MLPTSPNYQLLFTQRPQAYILKHGLPPEYTITTVSLTSQVLPGHRRDSACFGDTRVEEEEIQKEDFEGFTKQNWCMQSNRHQILRGAWKTHSKQTKGS